MSLRLTFHIKIKSDYHVGAGHGLGVEIDSALLRDANGDPVLRGTTVVGLLRDGLWRLLQQEPLADWRRCEASGEQESGQRYCGQYGPDDAGPCPVCRVFGSPRARKRWRISSAQPVSETETQPVTRVRVNPRTRRAAPRQLFSEEQGRAMAFEFTATCPSAGEAALDEAALLVAAARFVRGLGGSRRRGQGECRISLTQIAGAESDTTQDELLQRFRANWIEGQPHPREAELELLSNSALNPDATGGPVRLRLTARAEEPLIIARRPAAGNRFEGQDAISGKVLLGALAARAAAGFDLDEPQTRQVFADLFLRGDVTFPALTPVKGGYSAIPLPADAFACKVYKDHPLQWGTQSDEHPRVCTVCGSPVRRVHDKWLLLAAQPQVMTPDLRSEMHIQVAPEKDRVAEGQLYEYRALERGQLFAGDLVCQNERAWEQLRVLADLSMEEPITLRLGKATRRGYGRVTLWIEPLPEDALDAQIQPPLSERVAEGDKELTLLLLTDTVARDAGGRCFTGFDGAWLSEALGIDVMVKEGRAFASTHMLDDFNAKRCLPGWRDLALKAGAAVRLKLARPLTQTDIDKLQACEAQGIGQRTHEGYGRIAINPPIYLWEEALEKLGWHYKKLDLPEIFQEIETESEANAPFEKTWTGKLDAARQWDECRGDPYKALARWLYEHQKLAIPELREKMTALGQIKPSKTELDDSIPDDMLVNRLDGSSEYDNQDKAKRSEAKRREYGARDKANRLAGTPGFKMVQALLNDLATMDDSNPPLGVKMLADRLALAAEQKKEA